MNLYNLHTKPEQLDHFKDRLTVPGLAYKEAHDLYFDSSWATAESKARLEYLEPYIAKDAESAFEYVDEIRGTRWPEAEPAIITDPKWAYYYAKDYIQGRWPEAEQVIKQEPQWSVNYANRVINGRWPQAEKIIMRNPFYASRYSIRVIKGRWPEAEKFLKAHDEIWAAYISRWGIEK